MREREREKEFTILTISIIIFIFVSYNMNDKKITKKSILYMPISFNPEFFVSLSFASFLLHLVYENKKEKWTISTDITVTTLYTCA